MLNESIIQQNCFSSSVAVEDKKPNFCCLLLVRMLNKDCIID